MNVGGVRASLLYNQITGGEQPGEITYGEAYTVQPFANNVMVQTCTGEQLYDVLEQQFENPAAGSQRVMAVSGFTYSYYRDKAAAGLSRYVVDGTIKIGGYRRQQGVDLPRRHEQLHSDGGDGFTVFTQCTNPLGGEIDIDAFVRYFGAHSPVSPPPLEPDHAARP